MLWVEPVSAPLQHCGRRDTASARASAAVDPSGGARVSGFTKCIRGGEMIAWGTYPRITSTPHVYISRLCGSTPAAERRGKGGTV